MSTRFFFLLIALAAVLGTPVAHSQTERPMTAIRGERLGVLQPSAETSGLKVDRRALADPSGDTGMTVRLDGTPAPPETREMNLVGSTAVLLELGRMTPEGRWVGPKLHVGSSSPQLKSMLKSVGVEAERCMLPLVRGRVNRDPNTGDYGTTLWVTARCRFY
jgi:hypothetical protein